MKKTLESLRISALTNMEAGQLMRRHLGDLGTIDPTLLTNAPYNKYVQAISNQCNLFESALARVQKNEETEKTVQADANRDKAISAFGIALKFHAQSDIPEEVEASRSLSILFGTFKNLAKLNYEAETLGIDKLVSELNGPNYSGKITLLQMGKNVTRLADTNAAFKSIFGGRMVTTAMTETYDMKIIRADLQEKYTDFAEYVLAMAKAVDTPLFNKALDLLNTARKYYADQLARHTAPKAKKEKPAV
jgi:hypothetical protein